MSRGARKGGDLRGGWGGREEVRDSRFEIQRRGGGVGDVAPSVAEAATPPPSGRSIGDTSFFGEEYLGGGASWRRDLLTMRRPLREWCACVRAGDTRINRYAAEIGPYKDLPECGLEHHVRLEAESIRRLIAPVEIDWPGVPRAVAADRLGRHPDLIRVWASRGMPQSKLVPGRPIGRGKGEALVVWSHSLLDPNGRFGRGPDAVFGTMWQSHLEPVPGDAVLEARRVPRRSGEGRGWEWVCPGVGGHNAQGHIAQGHMGCGRVVGCLYLPLREWTLLDALGVDPLEGRGTAQEALTSQSRGQWHGSFACAACHGVQMFARLGTIGWNTFVGRMSGGLLFGSEVARPREFAGVRRIRAGARARAMARRERVMGLVGEGLSRERIARVMGVSNSTVERHVRALCAERGVASMRELREGARKEGKKGSEGAARVA